MRTFSIMKDASAWTGSIVAAGVAAAITLGVGSVAWGDETDKFQLPVQACR